MPQSPNFTQNAPQESEECKSKEQEQAEKMNVRSPVQTPQNFTTTDSMATRSSSSSSLGAGRFVPPNFFQCQVNVLEKMVGDMLARIARHNDQIPVSQAQLTRFHSRAPPAISVPDYLQRIVQFASVEKACLLSLLIYIDRVCERHQSFTISSLTIHRFMITAVCVSAKTLCDSYCTNSHYARVGGISTQELNTLELEFLFLIDWQLAFDRPLLQRYYEHLAEHHRFQRIREEDCSASDEKLSLCAQAETLDTTTVYVV